MVERSNDARLVQKLLHVGWVGDALGVGNLDRHRPGELFVAGQIDPAEPALTKQAEHAIAANRLGNSADRGSIGGLVSRRSQRCGHLRLGTQIRIFQLVDASPQLVSEFRAIAANVFNGREKTLALDLFPPKKKRINPSIGFHGDPHLDDMEFDA